MLGAGGPGAAVGGAEAERRVLPARALGTLAAPAQGLGCMGLSEFRGPVDERRALRTVHRALDLGVTMLDTADIYGRGRNEELVGRAVRGRRDQVVLSTKFGIVRTDDPNERSVNGRADYVRRSCEQSLRRLGVDHIDLYYVHRIDPATPLEETMLALAGLVAEGKVRHVGLSEASPEEIRRAHAVHPVSAVQSEWSLWSRELEAEVAPTCRELGIGIVAFSPLARGILSDGFRTLDDLAADDDRRRNPRFAEQNFDRNLLLVAALRDLARECGATVNQLALAWVQARGADVVPIPGAERPEHVDENARAVHLQLSPDELRRIEELSPAEAVAGFRLDRCRAQMLR
ncbi:aldo/keto reductase [Streptomyces sp. Y1]|uniref:Aldo/keto reductase n=1 Tax=Streptomyces sp. Y1 TaxID=3238634 RepID=A0AB39TGG6_9ACTN